MKRLILLLVVATTSIVSCSKAVCTNECQEVRNVIFMIGDGMGLAQTSMFMIENGYQETAFDKAQNVALIKTYSANNRVTDSAAAGTALACGTKTNNSTVGISPKGDTLVSIAAAAKRRGKSTGFVVTCSMQDATPAAFYAHSKKRSNFTLITEQFLSSQMDVAIGGGAKFFDEQIDGQKMIDIAKQKGYSIASSFEELSEIESGKVLGLFAPGNLNWIVRGRQENYLEQATAYALNQLAKDEDGFFLMVEGSLIDHAAHANDAEATLAEIVDFERSVKVAMDFADANPGTLVIITADHETGGLSMVSGNEDFTKAESGLDYKFSTGGHSGILVPVYSYGTGAERISGVMENTELSDKILEILELSR